MWMLLSACAALAPQVTFQSRQVNARPFSAPAAVPLLTERGAPPLPWAPTLFGRGVTAADVDRDGLPDFVIATATGAVVYRNAGSQGFVDESATRLPMGLMGSSAALMADVNQDGWQDLLLLADTAPGHDVLLMGQAPGNFGPPIRLPQLSTITSDAEFFDADGDGDLDLVRSVGASGHSTSAGADQLALNSGTGTFTEVASFTNAAWNSATIPTTGVAVLDANGDGVQDLYFTRADSGSATGSPGAKNLLIQGLGGGQYMDASSSLPNLDDNSYDAVPVDIDLDGDLDLVVANSVIAISGASSGDVLVNQGGAQGGTPGLFLDRFDAIDEVPILPEAIRLGLLVADVNLDGYNDVLVRVHDLPPGGHQPLFIGRDGAFDRAHNFQTGSFVAAGGAFADIDGDGDPDLLLTSAGSAGGGSSLGVARLFVNRTR